MQEDKARAHSIFEDPAIAEAAKNDPFVRFVSRNYRSLLAGLIAVGLSILAYNGFQTTAEQKRANATQALIEIQQGYDELVTKQRELQALRDQELGQADSAKKEELKKTIESAGKDVEDGRARLKLMVDALSSPQPFDVLAKMYKGLVSARTGDMDSAYGVLESVNWESVGADNSPERMSAELVTLALARALMDSPSHVAKTKEILAGLARKGSSAAVQAAVAFASIAGTADERAQAKELIDSVAVRFPSQEKFLQSALDRLAV